MQRYIISVLSEKNTQYKNDNLEPNNLHNPKDHRHHL